jgi:hypothetical protein
MMRPQVVLLTALLAFTLGCGPSQPPTRQAAPP